LQFLSRVASRSFSPIKGALGFLALWVCGCQSCEKEKPYTPFAVASGHSQEVPSSASSSAGLPATGGAPAFVSRRSELAPKNAPTWRLGDQELVAPPGFVFSQALSADFNDDSRLETVAWLVPLPIAAGSPSGPGPAALPSAWLFEAEKAPRLLVNLPSFIPTAADCQQQVALNQTGPHTLTLDIRADCQTPLIARAPNRALLVLSPFGTRLSLLTLRIAPPPLGETQDFSVDSTDRDGDHADDVQVNALIGEAGDPAARASAPLVWLDRALGFARDPSEPAKSLGKLASATLTQSGAKGGAKRASSTLRALIRTYSAMCAESGTYRITNADGGALPCGNLDRVAFQITQVRLRIALKQKLYLEALAALATSDWYLGKPDAAALKKLTADFKKSLTLRGARKISIGAQAISKLPTPRFSPLLFDANGNLLLLTDAGVARINADGVPEAPLDPVDQDAGLPGWPLAVVGPNLSWVGMSQPCDTPFITFNFNDLEGRPLPPVLTSYLAPRPGSCGGRKPWPSALTPLGFKDGLLHALVGPLEVGPPGQNLADLPYFQGTPRSADGKLLVVPSAFGLLVTGTANELWSAEPGSEFGELSDCVIQNGGERVACLEAGRPVLFQAQGALARSK